jgi:hypothetical protein
LTKNEKDGAASSVAMQRWGQPRVGFLTQLHSNDYRRKEFFDERVGIRRPFLPTGLCTELVTAKKIPAQDLA